MEEKVGPSFKQRAIAALILAVAAFILLKLIVGIAVAIGGFVIVIVAVIAIIWALNVLL